MQGTQDASVTYEQLYVSANHGTKVFLVHTPVGSCVLKRWASQRVRAGGNRFQPLAEYSALLDLHNMPNINAPIKITLDSSGADYIYVHCGNNALTWRARLEELHEHDAEQQQQSIEQLARHVAVHVLLALQELHKRGIVHRDVKPSNILLASPTGPTWLSDMGLATAAQQLPGFVKGLDLAYVPPEYITAQQQQQQWAGSSSSSGGWAGGVCWQVLDDLPALAQLTTAAADMCQLGLSIYQLLRGSLPQQLTPARAVAGSPRRLSSLLQKVATFDWKSEIQHSIMNSEAAEFLKALLCKDPALRPEPHAALQRFAWLQPAVGPALQLVQQQQQRWPQQRQEALRAAKFMELVQLQEEVHSEAAEPLDAAATAAAAAAEAAGLQIAAAAAAGSSREGVDTWGEWVARDETDHAVASSSSSSGSGSRTGHEAWAHDMSSATDAAGAKGGLGMAADTVRGTPAAAAGADRAAVVMDTWGPDSGDGGTAPAAAAAAAAAAADAWGSSSGKVCSREGPAAVGPEVSGVRPSYSGVLKREGSAAADVPVARGAVWELAPAGEQQHDGW